MDRPEYLQADPAYRRKIIIIIIVIAIGGVLCLQLLMPLLGEYLAKHEPDVSLNIVKYLLLFLVMIPALFSMYLIRMAIQINKHGQFPPPATRVIKDTRILYDSAAKIRARVLIVLAIVLFVLCTVTAVFALSLTNLLK